MSFIKKILIVFGSIIEFFVINWPGPVGRRFRYRYYKNKLKYLGENVVFDAGVKIISPEWISVDDNTWIDFNVIIIGGPPSKYLRKIYYKQNDAYKGIEGEVKIGKNCHIAANCVLSGHGGIFIGDNSSMAVGSCIYSFSHHYRNLNDLGDNYLYKYTPMAPPDEQALILGPVMIKSNAAICINSVVLPGATIEEYGWLGSFSMLTDSIPSGMIASGIPAKPIKSRFNE